jgi:hypothetical protein
MGNGRPANQLSTSTLNVSTTPQIRKCLEKLVATGAWGKNPSEAAERIISSKVLDFAREGIFLKVRDLEVPPP